LFVENYKKQFEGKERQTIMTMFSSFWVNSVHEYFVVKKLFQVKSVGQ